MHYTLQHLRKLKIGETHKTCSQERYNRYLGHTDLISLHVHDPNYNDSPYSLDFFLTLTNRYLHNSQGEHDLLDSHKYAKSLVIQKILIILQSKHYYISTLLSRYDVSALLSWTSDKKCQTLVVYLLRSSKPVYICI